jgi:DNA polymerase type B, organellar and viral
MINNQNKKLYTNVINYNKYNINNKNIIKSPNSKMSKFKHDFKYAFFTITNFTLENFKSFIIRKFKLHTTYSILIKTSYHENLTFKMCGSQIGLVIADHHDTDYYEDLYYTILARVDSITDIYAFNDVIEGVEIIYTIIKTIPELTLKNINTLSLPKKIVNITDIRSKFNSNLLPFTLDTSYYGIPILEEKKEHLNNQISKQSFKDKYNNNLIINKNDTLFLYQKNEKKENFLILSKHIGKTIFHRYIFNTKTYIMINSIKDVILDSDINTFNRTINNVTLTIKNQQIIAVNITHNLNIIEYKPKKIISEININIGTFDLETFVDTDGLAKVYAIGFITSIEEHSRLFYLKDYTHNFQYDILVLNCIDNMLVNKYHNFIFYCHNFGRYDCIFLYNILAKANINKGFEYYKLETTIRDDVIIQLTIKIKPDKDKHRYIKINIVDSLNLLNNSLDKLTKDFNVDIKKSIFPHSFVNRDNLNYIGNMPDIKYYKNLSLKEYNHIYKDS